MLRSFSNTWAPASSFEFDFFRINGGMIDFLEIISKDNSSIKTDMAFKRLKSNCIKMGINPKIIDLRGTLFLQDIGMTDYFLEILLRLPMSSLMILWRER